MAPGKLVVHRLGAMTKAITHRFLEISPESARLCLAIRNLI